MEITKSAELGSALRSLWSTGARAGLSDSELLERFAGGQPDAADAAFEALLQRHGAMVLRVCRDVLDDPHDADDAFQATFLVLIRRSGSIRQPRALSSWLHGVATRVALRARYETARRRQVERQGASLAARTLARSEVSFAEPALHEEVQRLPEKYRAPIVLCYIADLTHEQAAAQLGWPVGTVRGRLARARDLLRRRLTRRGLAVPAALLTAGLLPSKAHALVPASLAESTVSAAANLAASGIASLPARLARWTSRGLRAEAIARTTVIAALLISGAIGLGLLTATGIPSSPALQPAPEKKSDPTGPLDQPDRSQIQGTWSKIEEITHFLGGVAQPAKRYKYMWSVTADTITTTNDEGFASQVYHYTLDPTAHPKTIELKSLPLGYTLHGIYRLDGNTLDVCFGHERPKTFEESPGQVRIVLPREGRKPVAIAPEYANARGCYWAWAPKRDLPASMSTSGGISAFIKRDPQGALVVNLATISRIVDGEAERVYRPVAFDDKKTRFLFSSEAGGTSAGVPFRDVALAHNEHRLDPAGLPFDRVKALGIEVVPTEARREEKMAAATAALRKARDAGIELLPRPEVGHRFDFTLTTASGKTLGSSDFKGKVLLIDCWATWCTPCMAKMPQLKAIYQRRQSAGFEVIGVNFDHERTKADVMIRKLALNWPQYFVPAAEATRQIWDDATGITSLPRLLLIDRDGILRWDGGPGELEDRVEALLGKDRARK
jgi:RNA polymerase sigma factor (sigma-70 family)